MPGSYFVYVLKSERTGRFYIGHTSNLQIRVQRHNAGQTRSGRRGAPWRVVYQEEFASRGEAVRRERAIKKAKSRKYLEALVRGHDTPTDS